MDCFDPVSPLSTEQVYGFAVRIQFEVVLDDIQQAIELLPHIGVAASDIDFLHMGKIS